jgi:hypothetical protein
VQAWCRDTVTKHQKQESLDSALQKELAENFQSKPKCHQTWTLNPRMVFFKHENGNVLT